MSSQVFPSLPGLKWDVKKRPLMRTSIKSSVSGKESRLSYMTSPIWQFSLSYDMLRSDSTQELQTLLGFFLQMKGSFDTFLYTDPNDSSVVDQQFGTGNGSIQDFQLLRTLGGFVEPIQNLNGAIVVKDNGVTKTLTADYTIGTTGIVHFVTAPVAGHVLTWTGSFYFRCRFMQDQYEFNNFAQQLFDLDSIDFQSVKL